MGSKEQTELEKLLHDLRQLDAQLEEAYRVAITLQTSHKMDSAIKRLRYEIEQRVTTIDMRLKRARDK